MGTALLLGSVFFSCVTIFAGVAVFYDRSLRDQWQKL